MKFATIRKALAGAAAAAVAAAIPAYPDGFTNVEIGTIVGAAIVAGLGVWRIPNTTATAPAPGEKTIYRTPTGE